MTKFTDLWALRKLSDFCAAFKLAQFCVLGAKSIPEWAVVNEFYRDGNMKKYNQLWSYACCLDRNECLTIENLFKAMNKHKGKAT